MYGKIFPQSLKWNREDELTGDYDTGAGYRFLAETPFCVQYVVRFDDSDAAIEFGDAAVDGAIVSLKDWKRIRSKHGGDPSDTNARWTVEMAFEGADEVHVVAEGLSRFDAQTAAYMDYTYRVNSAIGIQAQYPNFAEMFRLMGEVA